MWRAAGYLLDLSSNVCMLLGIPLTLVFQLAVQPRPVRELFATGTRRFPLDPAGGVIALVLSAVRLTFAVRGIGAESGNRLALRG